MRILFLCSMVLGAASDPQDIMFEDDGSISLLQTHARVLSASSNVSASTLKDSPLVAKVIGAPHSTISVWSCGFFVAVVIYCVYALLKEPMLAQIRSYQLQLILYTACILLSPRLWCYDEWGQQVGMVWQSIFESVVLMVAFVSLPSCLAAYKVRCAAADGYSQNKHDEHLHLALAREAQKSLLSAWLPMALCLCVRIVFTCFVVIASHMQWIWFPGEFASCCVTVALLLFAVVIGMRYTIFNFDKISLGSVRDIAFGHALVSSTLLVVMAFQDICFPLIFKSVVVRNVCGSVLSNLEIFGALLLQVFIFEATMVKLKSALSVKLQHKEKDGQHELSQSTSQSVLLIAAALLPDVLRPAMESVDEPVHLDLPHGRVDIDDKGQSTHKWHTTWPWVLCDFFSIRVRSRFLPCVMFSAVLLFYLNFENSSAFIANTELLNTVRVLLGALGAWLGIGLITLSNNIYWNPFWLVLTMLFVVGSCGFYLEKMSSDISVVAVSLKKDIEAFASLAFFTQCCAYLMSIGALGLIAFSLLHPGEEGCFFQALVVDASAYARWLLTPTQRKSKEFLHLGKRLYGTAVRFPPMLVLSFVTAFPFIVLASYWTSFLAMAVLDDVQLERSWINAVVGEPSEANHVNALFMALDANSDGRLSKGEVRLAHTFNDVQYIVEPMLPEHCENEIGVDELSILLRHARTRHAFLLAWRDSTEPFARAQDLVRSLDLNGDGLLDQDIEFSTGDAVEALRDSGVLSMPPQIWTSLLDRLPMLWAHASSECGGGLQTHGIRQLDSAQLACFMAQTKYEAVRIQVPHRRTGLGANQALLDTSSDRHANTPANATVNGAFGIVRNFMHYAIDGWGSTRERIVVIMDLSLFLSFGFAIFVLFKPFVAHVQWYEDWQKGERDIGMSVDVLRTRLDYATFFPGVYFSTVMLAYALTLVLAFVLMLLISSSLFWQVVWSFRVYLAAYLVVFIFTWLILRRLILDKYCLEDGVVVAPRVFACVWCALTFYNFATGALLALSRVVFIVPSVAFKMCEFDTCILSGSLQTFDVGYTSFVVLNHMNYENTHPLHVAFLMALDPNVFMLRRGVSLKSPQDRRQQVARNRWHLARLLIQNGSLVKHRNRKQLVA